MRNKAPITDLLLRWKSGDAAAVEELLPVVYDELRRIARRYLRRERSEHTLQSTEIVHETFLELCRQKRVDWRERSQFFGLAAQLMRRILVAHARRRSAGKRGGGQPGVALQEGLLIDDQRPLEVLAVDEALRDLASFDPQKASIVELRFFGGLTVEETGAHLGVSAATVDRHWRVARAWLFNRLRDQTT